MIELVAELLFVKLGVGGFEGVSGRIAGREGFRRKSVQRLHQVELGAIAGRFYVESPRGRNPPADALKSAYAQLYEKQFRYEFYQSYEKPPAKSPAAPAAKNPPASPAAAANSSAVPPSATSAANATASNAPGDANPVSMAKNHFGELLDALPEEKEHSSTPPSATYGRSQITEAMRLEIYRYASSSSSRPPPRHSPRRHSETAAVESNVSRERSSLPACETPHVIPKVATCHPERSEGSDSGLLIFRGSELQLRHKKVGAQRLPLVAPFPRASSAPTRTHPPVKQLSCPSGPNLVLLRLSGTASIAAGSPIPSTQEDHHASSTTTPGWPRVLLILFCLHFPETSAAARATRQPVGPDSTIPTSTRSRWMSRRAGRPKAACSPRLFRHSYHARSHFADGKTNIRFGDVAIPSYSVPDQSHSGRANRTTSAPKPS